MGNLSEPLTYSVAVVDDHQLFRSGLINLLQAVTPGVSVAFEASNGQELLNRLEKGPMPDIILMDMHMPMLDGYEAAKRLEALKMKAKVLIVTMVEDEKVLIRMLKVGIRGYIGKDAEPGELREAISTVLSGEYFYPKHVTGRLINAVFHKSDTVSAMTEREQNFLELACSELTYKEIADQMNLSIKTVDGYRNALFEKFEVKSRVGLVLYAIRNRLVSL